MGRQTAIFGQETVAINKVSTVSLGYFRKKKKKKNSGKYGQCTPSLFFMNPDCTLEYVGVVYIRGYGRDVASVLHTQHVLVSANNDEK